MTMHATKNLKIGIHMLTAYPPSNPNRDENGQPKSAIVGGVKRQRISSQCIKRTWRLSEIMQDLEANYSTRTREIGLVAANRLIAGGIAPKLANAYAFLIVDAYGSRNSKRKSEPVNAEMVTLGFEEVAIVHAVVDALLDPTNRENADAVTAADLLKDLHAKPPVVKAVKGKGKKGEIAEPTEESVEAAESADGAIDGEAKAPKDMRIQALHAILQRKTISVDVGMFGRMRAGATHLSVDASIYVSHCLTTGKAAIDSDYWTAVDDLNAAGDPGAGGMGDAEFGSGTFYTYVQVSLNSLIKNLDGNAEQAKAVVLKLIETMAQTSPGGHKSTFNSEVRASFMRVEIGQPSSNLFCKAYEVPVTGTKDAIEKLQETACDEVAAFDLNQLVIEFSSTDRALALKPLLAKVEAELYKAEAVQA